MLTRLEKNFDEPGIHAKRGGVEHTWIILLIDYPKVNKATPSAFHFPVWCHCAPKSTS